MKEEKNYVEIQLCHSYPSFFSRPHFLFEKAIVSAFYPTLFFFLDQNSMETTMCIQWKSNYLGCVYYSSHSLELLLMEDIKESDQFEYITMCKQ